MLSADAPRATPGPAVEGGDSEARASMERIQRGGVDRTAGSSVPSSSLWSIAKQVIPLLIASGIGGLATHACVSLQSLHEENAEQTSRLARIEAKLEGIEATQAVLLQHILTSPAQGRSAPGGP